MTLKYALCPNNLKTGAKNSYLAKVQTYGSVNLDGIVERICYPGSGITKGLAEGVLFELNKAIENSLSEGYTVNLPFVNIQPSIKGQFTGVSDCFQPNRHQLCFTVSPGKSLKYLPKEIRLKKVSKGQKNPIIRRIINKYTGEDLQELKPLMVVEIIGSKFSFPKKDEEVGVFVVTSKQQVRAQVVHCKSSSSILALLPKELPLGEARIKVIVRYQHHKATTSCYSLPFQTHCMPSVND